MWILYLIIENTDVILLDFQIARVARVVAPEMRHHVTPRGNRRLQTFFNDEDYQAYLELMSEWCARYKGCRSLHAIFNGALCRKCSKLNRCPVRAPNHRDRGCVIKDTVGYFRLKITPQLRLRDQMYTAQQTDEWKQRYKIRSGIEATISELKRSHAFGRLRVRRWAKVCFAVACKVIACNIKRWARAAAGSNPFLRRIKWLIIDFIKAIEVALSKLRPNYASG